MDATPHLAFGSVLGMRIRSPLVAFAVGVGSHALLDAIPHFNYTGWRPVSFALVADVLIATCVALGVARIAPHPLGALAGAAGAAFPDIERVLTGHAKDFLARPPFGFHQNEIPPPWGLLTQAAVVGLSLALAWWWRDRFRGARAGPGARVGRSEPSRPGRLPPGSRGRPGGAPPRPRAGSRAPSPSPAAPPSAGPDGHRVP